MATCVHKACRLGFRNTNLDHIKYACAMLRRAQRLSQEKKRAASQAPAAKRVSNRDFSLRESALTRVLAWNVGRGASASGMQKISAAAVEESGKRNVHRSYLVKYSRKPSLRLWFQIFSKT